MTTQEIIIKVFKPLISKYTNFETFDNKVKEICSRLDIAPEWLYSVMYSESGFNPAAKNPMPGQTASGLIQFIERTAIGLGTTTAQLRQMTALKQLDYVEAYYKAQIKACGKPKTGYDLYFLTFYPAWVKNPSIVFKPPMPEYNANKFIDSKATGQITKQTFINWINGNAYKKTLFSVSSNDFKKKVV